MSVGALGASRGTFACDLGRQALTRSFRADYLTFFFLEFILLHRQTCQTNSVMKEFVLAI